jgi:methylenetetrahydrofolate reductase (NADPH)
VFDWNASDMLRAARALNDGYDASGAELKGGVQLFVGATANPTADNFESEVANAKRKIEAGAQFLQTQAVYEAAALEKFLDAVKPDGVAILVGIIPLKSHKMAAWLNTNVPGIRVPDALLKEMDAAAGTDREAHAGLDIAARTMRIVKPLCAGVHIMAMGWERRIPEMIQASGLR